MPVWTYPRMCGQDAVEVLSQLEEVAVEVGPITLGGSMMVFVVPNKV